MPRQGSTPSVAKACGVDMQLTYTQTVAPRRTLSNKKLQLVFIATIAVADYLIFQQAPGLNLFLLSLSLTSAVLMTARRPPSGIKAATCLGISALAAAPLLETPSVTGVIFAMTAVVSIALFCTNLLPETPMGVPLTLLRFIPLVPLRLPHFCRRYLVSHSGKPIFGTTLTSLAGWLLPLGMGLVFLLLFTVANPLIAMGLHNIDLSFLINLFDITRIGFWLLAAIGISSILRPRLIRKTRHHITETPQVSHQSTGFLDHTALLRCLWVFNLLFAMQTMLDVLYLWGGAELPAGMEPRRICPSWCLSAGGNRPARGSFRTGCHAPWRAGRQQSSDPYARHCLDFAECPALPVVHSQTRSLRANLFADRSAHGGRYLDGPGGDRSGLHPAAHCTASVQ